MIIEEKPHYFLSTINTDWMFGEGETITYCNSVDELLRVLRLRLQWQTRDYKKTKEIYDSVGKSGRRYDVKEWTEAEIDMVVNDVRAKIEDLDNDSEFGGKAIW